MIAMMYREYILFSGYNGSFLTFSILFVYKEDVPPADATWVQNVRLLMHVYFSYYAFRSMCASCPLATEDLGAQAKF